MAPRVHALPNIADRFNRWTVVGAAYRERGCFVVPCRCECGSEATPLFSNLYSGISKSCGCRASEVTATRNRTHGLSGTRLHRVWKGMLTRCSNPSHPGYKDYGALGVRVCHEWRAFEQFQQWATTHGYRDDLEIDRIDVTGNYEPANCRFVSHVENSRNKRRHRRFTAFGETKTLAEWAEDPRCTVKHRCLVHRLNRNWQPERALTTPSQASAA